MTSRIAALCCVGMGALALSLAAQAPAPVAPAASPAPAARPAGVQTFDQPAPGFPSPRNANYEIDVQLDPTSRTLRGRERLVWRNISNRPATELQFHLYWNAWRNRESTWLREQRRAGGVMPSRPEDYGSIDVTSIKFRQPDSTIIDLTPQIRFIAPDDGNAADRTVMSVPVPPTVQPNETVRIDIEWTSKVPFAFARLRTAWIDDYYFIAQWFPKIGVLEDSGWNTHQFHSATEFYADYGLYDVRITVPRGFVVGASGREQKQTENLDGTTVTHHYSGWDIADFAWTASPRFVEARRMFEHPTLPPVEMRLLLRPEHDGQQERHFTATAATLKYFGEWFGAYPYDHLTIVDPAYQSGSQGMEYPTLFVAGARWLAPASVTVPESVTIHEAGHQFWYGIVGSNEMESAWMDEGFTTFSTARVLDEIEHPNRLAVRMFDGFLPLVVRDIGLSREVDGNRMPGYRPAAEADVPADPTFRYWPSTASAISYNKTALWLHTLERHLGWPTLQRIMATYFDRWRFRHPTPDSFFQVANEVSGQDLTWFFDQVYRSSNTFDYGVQDVLADRLDNGGYRTTVVARRFGEATFPVDVLTTFENGEHVRERWDGRGRRAVYVYERPSRARLVEVDPGRVLLLDVNRTNNSVTQEPRGGEAGAKWSMTWMVWLQDLMLTYAFFI